MSTEIDEAEARLALSSIERRRQQVVAEINVPPWYWFVVAAGWLALGVLADYAPAWATAVGTLLFGAAHSTIAPRVLSGRRASPRLSVHGDLVSRRIPLLVIGFLVIMTMATIGFALLLNADGARHPATLASVVVAAIVLSGGPTLMGWIRRRAERQLSR
jgi:hypothetical protein